MTDTVFFDLDNTILDFNKAERVALSRTLEALGIPPTEEVCARYSVINLAQWKLLEKGLISRREVKLGRFRLLFEELGADVSPEQAAAAYESLLGIGHYFMEGAQELLLELRGRYRLYLVTNGTAAVQHGRLKSADLPKYFEDIFISEEIGFNKPDVRYFERCFERIPDFKKENAVIVGDRRRQLKLRYPGRRERGASHSLVPSGRRGGHTAGDCGRRGRSCAGLGDPEAFGASGTA